PSLGPWQEMVLNDAVKAEVVPHVPGESAIRAVVGALIPIDPEFGMTALQATADIAEGRVGPSVSTHVGAARLAVRRPSDGDGYVASVAVLPAFGDAHEAGELVSVAGRGQRNHGACRGGRRRE